MTPSIWRVITYCSAKLPVPETVCQELERRVALHIALNGMRYWKQLAELTQSSCGDTHRLASLGRRWIEHDAAPATNQVVRRSRYNLARLVAASGNFAQAEADAHKARLDSDFSNGIGVFLFQLDATLGRRDACEAIVSEMKRHRDTENADLTAVIDIFSKALKDGTIGAPVKAH